jgi:hypothetical protein
MRMKLDSSGAASALTRAFRQHGALAIQLLDPNIPTPATEVSSLGAYLDEARRETCPTLEKQLVDEEVSNFFQTMSPLRTRYIAQLLDGTFTFFALTVHDGTSQYLRNELSPLKLFLDTNFIFGLLDMHENPMSDVSKELIVFIVHQGFPYTLHVHERTLKEIRQTLDAMANRLRGRRWSSSLSRAACRTIGISGIELAYHKLNSEAPLDVDVFLSKFDHVEDLLVAQGIKIYRPSQSQEDSVERKGELIAEYLAYVEEHRPSRPRPYESADHDITVWLALQHLRGKSKTALDVGALFLSADVLFSRFDWDRLRIRDAVGTVVLPAQLLQVLRPFSKSPDNYDRKFVEAFSLPEFRSAHSDYSDTQFHVLSYLTTYSDVSEETAVRILTNKLVIDQLRGVEEGAPEFRELIDSALASDNRVLIEETEALRKQLDAERADKERALDFAALRARELKEDRAAVIRERESLLDGARAEERRRAEQQIAEIEIKESRRREKAEEEATQLRGREDARIKLDERRHKRARMALAFALWLLGALLIALVPHLTNWKWFLKHQHLAGIYIALAMIWGGVAWTVAQPKHWKGALGIVAVGGLIALVGIS